MVPLHNGCFVDVGANFGIWTDFVRQKGFKVHAFEPSPRPFAYLYKTKKDDSNVILHNVALGENECFAQMFLHKNCGNDSLVNREMSYTGKIIVVPVKTLDSFNLDNVGLIKLDTQGFEVPILYGARETIIRCKPRLVIEVHSPLKEQTEKILAFLRKINYHFQIVIKEGSRQPYVIAWA